jgi:uncharacterized protein (DUF362 family)
MKLSRRELMLGAGAAAVSGAFAKQAPTSPVAIARCRNFQREFEDSLNTTIDQIGGIGSLVRGKTVAVKLNLTGNPARFPDRPDLPYRNHPDTVLAVATLLASNGAKRIRMLESFFPCRQDMELWDRYGLDVNAINNVGCKVEWENTNNIGHGKKYERVKVPWGGYVFPAYDLNHSYVDCDVFVSMSKLKNHWIGGITMALKNSFGLTPCSLYGGDAYPNGNEDSKQERPKVCHVGSAKPAKGVPEELDPNSPRDSGYRVPRVTVDLVGVRPIDLSIVDGIESIRGGEGAWNKGIQIIKPCVMMVGKNPVCTDAVGAAVMGYDPRAERGTKPFVRGDNMLLLAEQAGIGTADLSKIEVAGVSVKDAMYDYGPGPIGEVISLPVG